MGYLNLNKSILNNTANNIIQLLWRRKYIFLFFFLFIIVLSQRFLNDKQRGMANSVASDGAGYYTYLPASIIYQDFTYGFYTQKENNISPFYNPNPNNTKYKDKCVLNKYYCGTSICLLPFFLLAIIISALAGTNINGYTDTFLMLVSIAPIIYYLLSTFLFTRIARFFKVSESVGFWLSLIFFFTTNLFHYVVQEPSMSHAYSFFAVTLFFYILTLFIKTTSTKNIVLLALSLGLIVLTRPPNILVILFIPFFFSTIKEFGLFFKEVFTKKIFSLILGVVVFMACAFIQLFFYYLQTGDFVVESYPGETFNFSKPEVFNILFSYKKGLFLYTPIIAMALLFIMVGKSFWYKRIVFIVTMSVFTYFTASWWCWYYGDSFSGRPFVDIYPLFIIALIVLYNQISTSWKKIMLVFCIPFLLVNQIMAYQYSHLIMGGGNMDKSKYWDIFLETDYATINQKRIATLTKHHVIFKTDNLTFENETISTIISSEGYKSSKSNIVGKSNLYSIGLNLSLKEIGLNESNPFYVILECDTKTEVPDNNNLNLILAVFEKDYCVRWDVVYSNQFRINDKGWKHMSYIARISDYELKDEKVIKLFTMCDKGFNLVDNLKYSLVQE